MLNHSLSRYERNNGEIMSPFSALNDLQREIDSLLNRFSGPSISQWGYAPSCDIQETDDRYMMTFDLPGVSKEDIKIEMVDHQFTVSGERKSHREKSEKTGWHLQERAYGTFKRSFTLPSSIEVDKIEAQYEDGILRVMLPKAEAARPRQIEIKSGRTGLLGRVLGKEKESDEKKSEKVA